MTILMDDDGFWTFEAVEKSMIEAMRLAWRDEPGRWPFAGDGPWHLLVLEWGDHGAHDPAAIPRNPLSRSERADMEYVQSWYNLIPQPSRRRSGKTSVADAKLVQMVIRKLAGHRGEGRGRVPWAKLLKPMGLEKGTGMLQKRYSNSITAIAQSLNKRGSCMVRRPWV